MVSWTVAVLAGADVGHFSDMRGNAGGSGEERLPTSALDVKKADEWYMRQIWLSATTDHRLPTGLAGSYISATVAPMSAAEEPYPLPPAMPAESLF